MISFLISLAALILGYFIYGRLVERIFHADNRPTPAVVHPDGVDYVPLPTWRIFTIQFLNIAGTGPIFGAIMGMLFGPAAYLWIVLGCIFAGAVHDYLTGMLSLRHDGAGLPSIIGHYLGKPAMRVMLVFSMILLLMVGAVFVYSPAEIMGGMTGGKMWWVAAIFAYYVVATLLPIDKVIGKVYPLFAIALLFMAVALLVGLLIKQPAMPELWDMGNMEQITSKLSVEGHDMGFTNFLRNNPRFPCLFITIACGAISGFHATQSPLMARCMRSERLGRPIFYGAMITEGLVALIWASISSYFFYCDGWKEVVSPEVLNDYLAHADKQSFIDYFNAPRVVKYVCTGWLGIFGGILAILGVVAAPITTGDTAFRSARLIIADFLKLEQRTIKNRLVISIPMFAGAFALLWWQMANPSGFKVLWQYFGWSNQTLSVFSLWAVTVYLVRKRKFFWVTLLPAIFMTTICSVFLLVSPDALHLNPAITPWASAAVAILATAAFAVWYRHERASTHEL